jgi:hypothetical protein
LIADSVGIIPGRDKLLLDSVARALGDAAKPSGVFLRRR